MEHSLTFHGVQTAPRDHSCRRTMRLLPSALCLAAVLCLNAQTAPAPPRIQALIITGQDKHPWRETTPYLREILNRTGKFEVRVTEEFHGATAETLAPYDVAV